MELPSALVWLLIALNLIWAVFVIVVLVNVLTLAKEAIPYFERENARLRAEQLERDRTKGIRSGSRY